MKRPARIAATLAAAGAVALAAPAAPALAGGFTLQMSAPETAVGRPMVIQVTGTIPPQDIGFLYWFSLDAIPTSFTTTCPEDRWVGAQFAVGSGGDIVVNTASERPDETGAFSIPVAVTPSAPGSLLLCGYTDDGEATTLARSQLRLDIQPAASSPAGGDPPPSGPAGGAPSTPRPAGGDSRAPSPPQYARQGIRACRVLLGGRAARRCVHDIVRRANTRCRKLQGRRARARCVRSVRRVARRT
jgi:hypothetical protein